MLVFNLQALQSQYVGICLESKQTDVTVLAFFFISEYVEHNFISALRDLDKISL